MYSMQNPQRTQSFAKVSNVGLKKFGKRRKSGTTILSSDSIATFYYFIDVAPLMDMGAEVTDVTDAMAVQVPTIDILNTTTEHLRPLIIILLTMQFIIIVDIFRLFQRENPFLISMK